MEILLNLCWLLLVAPTAVMWCRQPRSSCKLGCSSLLRLVALGCALLLLFPVISVSDDLHASNQEMDESSTTKMKAGAGDRAFCRVAIVRLAAAIPAGTAFAPPGEACPMAASIDGNPVDLLRLPGPSQGRAPPSAG